MFAIILCMLCTCCFAQDNASFVEPFLRAAGKLQKKAEQCHQHPYQKPTKAGSEITKKGSRFRSITRKKKPRRSSSEKKITRGESGPILEDEIAFDRYIQAISLYTACMPHSTPLLQVLIKQRINTSLRKIKQALDPIELDSPFTIFDHEYSTVLHNAQQIKQKPSCYQTILHTIQTDQQAEPSTNRLFMHLEALLYLYDVGTDYEKIMLHTFAEQTIGLIKTHYIQAQTIKQQQIMHAWRTLSQASYSTRSLPQQSCRLYAIARAKNTNSLSKTNTQQAYYLVSNLLFMHKHTPCLFKRYWIDQEISHLLKYLEPTDMKSKWLFPWKKLHSDWHATSDDISSLLVHIRQLADTALPSSEQFNTSSETHKIHLQHLYFKVFPVLTDMYDKYIVPPELLERIKVPLRRFLDTLELIDDHSTLCCTKGQEKNIEQAQRVMLTPTSMYALHYYMHQAHKHTKNNNHAYALRHYGNAARQLIHERGLSNEPMLFDTIRDYLFNCFSALFEGGMHFTREEFLFMIQFADEIGIEHCPKWKARLEGFKLNDFCRHLLAYTEQSTNKATSSSKTE